MDSQYLDDCDFKNLNFLQKFVKKNSTKMFTTSLEQLEVRCLPTIPQEISLLKTHFLEKYKTVIQMEWVNKVIMFCYPKISQKTQHIFKITILRSLLKDL